MDEKGQDSIYIQHWSIHITQKDDCLYMKVLTVYTSDFAYSYD